MGEFQALDWLAILGYLALALVVGTRLTRRASRSVQDFYLAGRRLPWWIAGTSIVATSFAADTPLVVTGWVRDAGVSANWIWWGFAFGGALSFAVLAAYWRRSEVVTDPQLIEMRYSGAPSRVLRGFYGGYHALVTNTIVLTWVIVAMIKIVRVVAGWEDPEYDRYDPYIAYGAMGLALSYSLLAGLWGVTLTDLFQFGLAFGGAILLAWVVIADVGGLSEAQSLIRSVAEDKTALIPIPPQPLEGELVEGGTSYWLSMSFWTQGFCAFLVYVGVMGWANKNADGGGPGIQRYNACLTETHARGAALWYHVAHFCLRPWPWILVALLSLEFIADAELPLIEKNGEMVPDHEMAYPMMMRMFLGPGLFGLMCAGFLGAFMSTLDTHCNLASAYVVNDLYRRFMVREASERHYVWIGRFVMLLVGVLGATFALEAQSIDHLFRLTLSLFGGLGPALLLRWFWWRANAWTEFSALATSTALTLVFQRGWVPAGYWPAAAFNDYQPGVPWDYPGQYLVLIGASLAVMLTVTLLTPPVEMSHLRQFQNRIRPLGVWGKVRVQPRNAMERRAWRAALATWIGGVLFILGGTLLLGALLLGQPWTYYAGATGLGLLMIVWGFIGAVPPALGQRRTNSLL